MNLSKNLSLAEACITSSHLPNVPNEQSIANLKAVAEKVFQKCRDHFGKPLTVNSGYRSAAVNQAKKGALSSQHLTGQALDMTYGNKADNKSLFDYIRHNLMFDQLIWEAGDNDGPDWVHVSYNGAFNRRSVLKMEKVNGKSTYKKLK